MNVSGWRKQRKGYNGTRLKYKGQEYELTDTVKDYVNAKGVVRPLRLIRAGCADCGEPFEFWQVDDRIEPKRFSRRCEAHRNPLVRVRAVHALKTV